MYKKSTLKHFQRQRRHNALDRNDKGCVAYSPKSHETMGRKRRKMWNKTPLMWWQLHLVLSAGLWQSAKIVTVTLSVVYLHASCAKCQTNMSLQLFLAEQVKTALKMNIVCRAYTGWRETEIYVCFVCPLCFLSWFCTIGLFSPVLT